MPLAGAKPERPAVPAPGVPGGGAPMTAGSVPRTHGRASGCADCMLAVHLGGDAMATANGPGGPRTCAYTQCPESGATEERRFPQLRLIAIGEAQPPPLLASG